MRLYRLLVYFHALLLQKKILPAPALSYHQALAETSLPNIVGPCHFLQANPLTKLTDDISHPRLSPYGRNTPFQCCDSVHSKTEPPLLGEAMGVHCIRIPIAPWQPPHPQTRL